MALFSVQRLVPTAILPTKDDPTNAGIDIYTNESYVLSPGERHAFSTGLAIEFPDEFVVLLWDRSGLGSKGIHRLAGVIDSGYRGEWKIILLNTTNEPYAVTAGDKIIQCVLQRFESVEIVEAQQLTETVRGAHGFGSSGR